ncbi:MAG: hypothetical protein AB7G20_00870, partial [Sulfurimonas sp.]
MTTLNETIITDMGILSNEVYNNEKYFTFKQSGQREYNEIVTFNGTYTIIDSTDNPNDPNTIHSSTGLDALLLRAPDGQYVIAFRGTQEGVDILVDLTIFLTSLATGTGIAWNAQRSDAEKFVAKMIKDYNISSSNLALTGHSLGGILAQTIASTQNLEAYTFNALGTTGLTRFENPNGTNILNLSYTDDGFLNGDPLSNAATFFGNQQVGEVLPMIGEDLGFGAHGMDYMNAVIATYNFILESFISETTYRDVTQAYLENSRLDGFFGNTYEKTNQYLFTDVNISTGSSLSFNFLNDLTASQIEQQAKSDRAVLFAILKLNGFAVDGNLTAYSNMDLAHYSEAYIAQRSLFLYALLDPNNAKLANMHFSDRDMGISRGGSAYSGGGGGVVSYTPHTYTPAPTPVIECINSPVYHSTGTGGGGSSTGPIVLDLNRDGITSISIAASQALFDYDNDGVKENTAWIQSTDALLVNDKNSDGINNNASELFGNYTKNSDGTIAKSGYQALSYYDSNSDNVIDATDTRFNELSLWIDSNQDGVTDTGELKTLSEMGVTSLTINSATPYIPSSENTNTIIQETTFTDASGEGIMRDVLFRYENTSKPTDGVYFDMDANGIKEKMTTWTDPNEWMIVKDINNDGQITSGKEVVGNHMTLPNGTNAADTIQALKTFDINNDGKVDTTDNSGLAFWTDRNHNGLTDIGELEALGAAGAIQTIKLNPYQTLLSGYDNNHDGEINSSDKLHNYLYIQTNPDESVTLYLPDNAQAKEMIAGYTGGESIQTPQGEKIIKTILFYEGYGMTLNDTLEGTDGSETLEGSSRSETLRGRGGRDIIDAGAGDDVIEGGTQSDKLMGGEGNDTYIYNRGDGKDLIVDSAGNDTITFAEGITKDDLIIKTNGAYISIYLKDGSKPLSELSDQIIIKDWHTTSTLKTLTFSDATSLDARDIVLMFATDKNDTIYATQNSETINGGKGND